MGVDNGAFLVRAIDHIVEHIPEVAVLLFEFAWRKVAVVRNETEGGGELAATKVGLAKALTFLGAAIENADVLRFALLK